MTVVLGNHTWKRTEYILTLVTVFALVVISVSALFYFHAPTHARPPATVAVHKPMDIRSRKIFVSMGLCLLHNVNLHKKQEFPYFHAAVLASRLWTAMYGNLVTVVLHVVLVEPLDNHTVHGMILELENKGVMVVRHVLPVDLPLGISCPLVSQVMRMFTHRLDRVKDNDLVVTIDVDAFPSNRGILKPLFDHPEMDAWVWRHYYSEKRDETFPLSIIAMTARNWRTAVDFGEVKSVGDPIVPHLMRWNTEFLHIPMRSARKRWWFDQCMVTHALIRNGYCTTKSDKLMSNLNLPYGLSDDARRSYRGDCWMGNQRHCEKGCTWRHFTAGTTKEELDKAADEVLGSIARVE